jgi:hypothetical protein
MQRLSKVQLTGFKLLDSPNQRFYRKTTLTSRKESTRPNRNSTLTSPRFHIFLGVNLLGKTTLTSRGEAIC